MDRKPNVIYLSGKDTYGILLEKKRLKDAFITKYGNTNIDTIRIEEVKDWRNLEQDMITTGLFAEKRLFFISWGYKLRKTDETKEDKKEKKNNLAETSLIHILESLPDESFVIFSDIIATPKSSLMTWIMSSAQVKTYDTLWDDALWEKRFPEIDNPSRRFVIWHYRKIAETTEDTDIDISLSMSQSLYKISLLGNSSQSEKELSIEWIEWGKMFDLSDALLRWDARGSLRILRILLETTNIYALIGSLIGLIRPAVYTKYLKTAGKNEREIATSISAHPFVIKKAYESRLSYEKLRNFYTKLIDGNIAYKSGKWLSDPELWRIFSIERAIMGLKKPENT